MVTLTQEGEYEIQYIAEHAGDFELHLWCDTDGNGSRQTLPGSPFMMHVFAAGASASGSQVVGADTVRSTPLIAGERLELGIQLRDPFGNSCSLSDHSCNGHRISMTSASRDGEAEHSHARAQIQRVVRGERSPRVPSNKERSTGDREESIALRDEGVTAVLFCKCNGGHSELSLTDKLRPGEQLGAFSVGHELHVAGQYEAHLMLSGAHIKGSPVCFKVKPAAPSGRLSTLQAPEKAPVTHEEYELLLIAEDKYSNKLDRGGANVQARALGPSASPATTRDYSNGTYGVKFTAGAAGEYRVEVRLDNAKIKGSPHMIMFTDGNGHGKRTEGAIRATLPGDTHCEADELQMPAPLIAPPDLITYQSDL